MISINNYNDDDNVSYLSIDDKIEYTRHIIETHFQTFNWLDVKMQALLAIAAASMAVMTFAVKDLDNSSVIGEWLLYIAGIFLFAGMVVALKHLIPTMDSGVGNNTNPKVALSISNIKHKEAYSNIINGLSKKDMLNYNCYQIYGLAKICMSGQRHIRIATLLVGTGLLMLFATIGVRKFDNKKDEQKRLNCVVKIVNNT